MTIPNKPIIDVANYIEADDVGPIQRSVAIDKDGNVKPLTGINVAGDTTIQQLCTADGDILIQCELIESEEGYTPNPVTISHEGIRDHDLSPYDGMHPSVAEAVELFLTNPDPTVRHLIITGVTETVNNEDYAEVYRRRQKLATLFDGLTPPIRDRFVNFLDSPENSEILNKSSLSWETAFGLPAQVTSYYSYSDVPPDDDNAYESNAGVICWHKGEGDAPDTVVQTNVAAYAQSIITKNTISCSIEEIVPASTDPTVDRVLRLVTSRNVITGIDMYKRGNLPRELAPIYMLSSDPTSYDATDYLGGRLIELDIDDTTMMSYIEGIDQVWANGWFSYKPNPDSSFDSDKIVEAVTARIFPEGNGDPIIIHTNDDKSKYLIVFPKVTIDGKVCRHFVCYSNPDEENDNADGIQ